MIKFCPNCGKEVSSKFCPYCGCEVGKFVAENNNTPVNETPAPVEEIPVITIEPEFPANEPAAPAEPTVEPVVEAAPAEPVAEEPVAPIQETVEPVVETAPVDPTPTVEATPAQPEEPPVFTIGVEQPAQNQTAGSSQNAQQQYQQPQGTPDLSATFGDYYGNGANNTNVNNANYDTYYIPPEQQKESVTHKTWFIILFLIIFWPLGLFFMWRAKKFSKAARIIITVIIGILFILNIVGTVAIYQAANEYDDTYDYDYSYDYDSDDVWDDTDYSGTSETIDGRTAYEAAQSYLNALNFSREGLIEQLEYEGYSNSAATAAVDSISVDWNEQAAGSARTYLNVFPDMTRSEMIDQLEYEGYTYSQAVYGADAVGL